MAAGARPVGEEHAAHEGWFWDPTKQAEACSATCGATASRWMVRADADRQAATFLEPRSHGGLGLLKWGLPVWREKLLKDRGVDYEKTPPRISRPAW